jgi:hypothetical protein
MIKAEGDVNLPNLIYKSFFFSLTADVLKKREIVSINSSLVLTTQSHDPSIIAFTIAPLLSPALRKSVRTPIIFCSDDFLA